MRLYACANCGRAVEWDRETEDYLPYVLLCTDCEESKRKAQHDDAIDDRRELARDE